MDNNELSNEIEKNKLGFTLSTLSLKFIRKRWENSLK